MKAHSRSIIKATRRIRHGRLSALDLPPAPSFTTRHRCFWRRRERRYATSPSFREYALARKQADASERIKLLATCDLMRHLPAEQIEQILPCIHERHLKAGGILFKAGDPGDALYIVADGKVEVLRNGLPSAEAHGGLSFL